MKRIFHLVPLDAWRAYLASAEERWAPPSLAAEGFVHCSHAEQLAGTLATHFAEHSGVMLFEVDGHAVSGKLVLEPSRGGALFPHLYRAIEREELLRSWTLVQEAGAFELPRLGERPEEDHPTGSAVP